MTRPWAAARAARALGRTDEEIFCLRRHLTNFVELVRKRKKYRCKCGGCIETAPAPPKLMPGGRYSIDLAISIALGKYGNHAAGAYGPGARELRRQHVAGHALRRVAVEQLCTQSVEIRRDTSPQATRARRFVTPAAPIPRMRCRRSNPS